MADFTPTPESQREQADQARKLVEALDKLDSGGDQVMVAIAFYQSAFTAGREAAMQEAENALLAHAHDADFCANSQLSWYEAQGPEAYAAAVRKCAEVIARLRSEGGGNG